MKPGDIVEVKLINGEMFLAKLTHYVKDTRPWWRLIVLDTKCADAYYEEQLKVTHLTKLERILYGA